MLSAFRVLFVDSMRSFSFAFSATMPPASTAPREGLHGGLLEVSCGRRRRIGMRNRPNVGTDTPAASEMKRATEGDVEKASIVHTITDKNMIFDVPGTYYSSDHLQNAHRKVLCRRFAAHM